MLSATYFRHCEFSPISSDSGRVMVVLIVTVVVIIVV